MAADERFERRLEAGLHRLLDQAAGPHPTWADSPARRSAERQQERPRRSSRPLLLMAAALLVGLAGTLAYFGTTVVRPQPAPSAALASIIADASGSPGTSPSTSATASPAPSAEPTAATLVGLAWNRVDDPDLASLPVYSDMSGAIRGGPGAIAWGFVYGAGPQIWTTADGLQWTSATVEAPIDADPDQREPGWVNDITAGGPGYVAVGAYYRNGAGNTALVWTSVDGMTWRRAPDNPAFAYSIMGSVIARNGGLLVYGSEAPGMEGGPQRVWASSDGLSWDIIKLSLPEGVDGAAQPVASTDRLWANAVRTVGGEQVLGSPRSVLTSTDGRTWVETDLPGIGSLHPLGDALYTLVSPWPLPSRDFTPPPTRVGQPSTGVYRSADLSTWTLRSRGLTTVGEDMIAVGDTLVMVGDDAAGDVQCWADCRATGWRSIDGGLTWQVVPADRIGGTMVAVDALADGTLVAVGRTIDDQGRSRGAAWVSRPVQP